MITPPVNPCNLLWTISAGYETISWKFKIATLLRWKFWNVLWVKVGGMEEKKGKNELRRDYAFLERAILGGNITVRQVPLQCRTRIHKCLVLWDKLRVSCIPLSERDSAVSSSVTSEKEQPFTHQDTWTLCLHNISLAGRLVISNFVDWQVCLTW